MTSVRSDTTGILWPALPGGTGATMLAVQYQLEQSQWWPNEMLLQHQLRQAAQLLRHAHATVPFHRSRLDAAGYDLDRGLTPELWRALPLMTRADIQRQGNALLSPGVPPAHGAVTKGETSGSTGRPITYYGTDLTQFFWLAFTLRDHLWHQRDFAGKLAAIRIKVEDKVVNGWGPATDMVFETGPCAMLHIRADIDAQIEWLQQQAPQYLISNASNLCGLARRCLEKEISLPSLLQARSFGGVLPDDARAMVRQAWHVGIADVYTAEEVGYIALQCPQHEHYHVQAENLIVEIVDEAGMPCAPGQIGRVVLTTLHNFAMPLVRYDIGDYAEVGEPCPCGRGLPVVRRIMGRDRNLLTLPDGRRRWPSYPSEKWSRVAPIQQMQVIQKSRDNILLRVVAPRALTTEEKQKLIEALRGCLGPFNMDIEQLAEIPRAANYKYEEFISEIR